MKSNNKIINDNLNSNTQRQIHNTDLLMTLWHTFNIRSNKDMRWVVLISFKSLNWHKKKKKAFKSAWPTGRKQSVYALYKGARHGKILASTISEYLHTFFFCYTTYCYFFSSFLASYSGNVVSNAERWLNSFIHCQNCDNWRTLLIWRGTWDTIPPDILNIFTCLLNASFTVSLRGMTDLQASAVLSSESAPATVCLKNSWEPLVTV